MHALGNKAQNILNEQSIWAEKLFIMPCKQQMDIGQFIETGIYYNHWPSKHTNIISTLCF